jgi:hypothetical protein
MGKNDSWPKAVREYCPFVSPVLESESHLFLEIRSQHIYLNILMTMAGTQEASFGVMLYVFAI